MKQLSIAVPSYNMEALLAQCLDSMADERLREALEVLIVDDGSRDGTARIAQEYAERFPEIFSVIRKENGGHGSAVNAALECATGRYFRIVDADDWVHTENLIRLTDILSETDADMILDEKTEVDAVSFAQTHFPFPEGMPAGEEVEFEHIALPEYRYHLALHTMSVKREILQAHHIRLLEKTFYVDSQFITEATAFVRSALVLHLPVYYYRVGNAAQSVHYLNYVKRYEEHNRVVEACIDFLERGEFEPSRRAFVLHSVVLLIHTQYKIALIFNPDRKQGRLQAKHLRKRLKEGNYELYRATKKRCAEAMLLNRLGIGYEGMEKLKRLLRPQA